MYATALTMESVRGQLAPTEAPGQTSAAWKLSDRALELLLCESARFTKGMT